MVVQQERLIFRPNRRARQNSKRDKAWVGGARRIKKRNLNHPSTLQTEPRLHRSGYPSVVVHGGTIQPARFSLAIYIQQAIVH